MLRTLCIRVSLIKLLSITSRCRLLLLVVARVSGLFSTTYAIRSALVCQKTLSRTTRLPWISSTSISTLKLQLMPCRVRMVRTIYTSLQEMYVLSIKAVLNGYTSNRFQREESIGSAEDHISHTNVTVGLDPSRLEQGCHQPSRVSKGLHQG